MLLPHKISFWPFGGWVGLKGCVSRLVVAGKNSKDNFSKILAGKVQKDF